MRSFEIAILGLALTILERVEQMEKKLTDAIANLNAEVEDEVTKLGSLKTYVEGVPGLIAAAVAEALNTAGVEEAAAADLIDAAREKAASSVTDTLSAVSANTQPNDTGGAPSGDTSGASGDGTGGTSGSDTSGAGGTGGGDGTTGGADAGSGAGDGATSGDQSGAGSGDGTAGAGDGTTGTGEQPVE